MRDAPSLAIVTALEDAGAKARAHDPAGMDQARAQLLDVTVRGPLRVRARRRGAGDRDRMDFAPGARFQAARRMASPSIADLRNVYRPEDVRRRGFRDVGIGISYGRNAEMNGLNQIRHQLRPTRNDTYSYSDGLRTDDGKVSPFRPPSSARSNDRKWRTHSPRELWKPHAVLA